MPGPSVHLRSGRAAVLVAFSFLTLLMVLVSCQEQRDYKVLSFFFDGVPDPNAPRLVSQTHFTEAHPLSLTPIHPYQHKPYALGQCYQCHLPDRQRLIRLSPADLCVRCHTRTTHEFPVMHGPVAAGLCLWCHDPHESDQPHLLKSVGPDLCLQCHDQQLLPPNPPHQADNSPCLQCHLGHGGADHGLLRNPRSPLARLPTTRLATMPATGGAP